MKCVYCGNNLEEGAKVCDKCGANLSEDINEDTKNERLTSFMILVKIALLILSIAVVIVFFKGAESVEDAASDMIHLRSVVGTSVNEAYYQYYGAFLSGLSDVIRGLGLTCGAIVLYISKRIDK